MAQSAAMMGYGTVLELALASAPTAFTYIAETKSITPPSFTVSEFERTHMQSPNATREFGPGLSDPGEASAEMNFIPGSPTDLFLLDSVAARADLRARLTLNNGMSMLFSCFVSGYERAIPFDDGQSATLTLRVNGFPSLVAIAAPRNLVLPTIDGIAKVGAPLLADLGVFAGATSIEYQWQGAGVDIVGATKASYVPVTADIGDIITVEVTGTNSLFSTLAESAATAAVIA